MSGGLNNRSLSSSHPCNVSECKISKHASRIITKHAFKYVNLQKLLNNSCKSKAKEKILRIPNDVWVLVRHQRNGELYDKKVRHWNYATFGTE